MKPKYRTVLYDSQGKPLVTLADRDLKKDAEDVLDAVDFDYAYASIFPVYVPKGGEAVGR